jgi:hypothetical protein
VVPGVAVLLDVAVPLALTIYRPLHGTQQHSKQQWRPMPMRKVVTASDRKTGPDYYTIVAWLDSISAPASRVPELSRTVKP